MSHTADTAYAKGQLDLFPSLAVDASILMPLPKRRRVTRKCPRSARPVQLSIFSTDISARPKPRLRPILDDEEDPLVLAPLVHEWVSATECARPATTAPSSIFAFAAGQGSLNIRSFRPTDEPKGLRDAKHGDVHRDDDGTVRHVRKDYTETDEWQEKERARRARQITPRPKRQTFKMKNSRHWADRNPEGK